ncbi:hypothetical protein ACFYRY_42240, partial [Streptomyces sp. NPDC005263]
TPPPAPPDDPEPEADLLTAFPALAGAQLAPPLALTLPALAPDDDQDGDDDQAVTVHQDGGMTAREAATLGVMVASAITVACLRGTVAFASWCRARAEHHRAVRAEAAKAAAKAAGTGGGRVPSGPEFGRATRSGGRAGTGSGGGGRSGGGSGGGRAPATFRSGSGSRGAGGSTRPGGGNSRPPTANHSGPGGRRRNGSGSPTSPSSGSGSGSKPPARRKRKNGGDSGGSGGSSDGGGTKLRGPKGIKRRKPKGSGSGTGGGSSSGGSGTSTSPKGKSKGPKGPKSGKGKGTGTSPASTSPKGKGGKGKGGKGKGGGSKSPATRTRATSPATRGARARALARRATVRAARRGGRLVRRGGRYIARVTPPAARRTGRYLNRNGRRVARHTRRWSRTQWDRIAARAEVRWQRRQAAAAAAAAAAAGTTSPGAAPTAPGSGSPPPPPGPPPTGPGTPPPPGGPGASPWGPGPGGGPWVGYGPLAPPPAVTDPYVVVMEREDGDEAATVELPELVVAAGDTPPPDAPPGQAWEPLRGVDGGWVLVDVAELVDAVPLSIPAARTEAAPASEETTPVSELPATPSAIADGVAAMSGPRYDSGASELTIYDLLDADQDAAEEIVARVDTAREDAKAARALVGHMEDLKATCIRYKIPGALYRYACRLQEKAAVLAADADALAKSLPAASEAISAAGKNAAVRHKPLADTVRDHGHAAPAETEYHG